MDKAQHRYQLILSMILCIRCNVVGCFILMLFVGSLPLVSSLSSVMRMDDNISIQTDAIWSADDTDLKFAENSSTEDGWRCHCWNLLDTLECNCEGKVLIRIPQKLHKGMQILTISKAGLRVLRNAALKGYSSSLTDFTLCDLDDFETIEPGAFDSILNLRTIQILNAPKLNYLTKDVFYGISTGIKTIKIKNSGLLQIPDMSYLFAGDVLHLIDFDGNHIKQIESNSVKIKTEKLVLDNNELISIENSAFYGSQIGKLSFIGNHLLRNIHQSAFVGIRNLNELDLSSTSLVDLPSNGLEALEVLKIENTHSLKTIPSIYNFKYLQRAWLTHSFHCCAFKFPSRHDPHRHAQQHKYLENLQKVCLKTGISIAKDKELLTKSSFPNGQNYKERSLYFSNLNDDLFENSYENNTSNDEKYTNDLGLFHDSTPDVSERNKLDAICGNISQNKIDVKCFPMPDALNPCEDVMGSHWLRASVWVVVLLAVFGNIFVLIVLLSNRSDTTVPKFLMNHLAFADLCMGLYLLLIALIDIHSMGEYFNYAFDWQYGTGCKVSGFLTVFASHLSVFTLTIITLERWFAITNAIYLNKRIKIKAATYIMIGGWIYSSCMSAFPLFGVSNYSSTSICLPMEARDSWDVVYLVAILGINGTAFFIIAICYAQIYFSLGKETRRAAARNASSGEMTIAKKMALLVFTNFSCWAPIAFFGLTALAGYPLINVTKSKILLVFFYPLNSCADPYLYAILTAQYRRDLYILLSRFGLCTQKAQKYKNSFSFPATNITYPAIQQNSLSQTNQKSHEENQQMLHEDFV